tara:strand:- start:97 stop:513 length:417 start_codon:yes stop_codon:yes gene_type:complete
MDPSIIIAAIFMLISVIGLVKKNRKIFLSGYMFYGFLVFFVEIFEYTNGGDLHHLFVAFLWLIQGVIAIPTKAKYDSLSVREARVKILLALSLINVTGFIAPEISPAPEITFYFHILLALLPLVVVYLLMIGKIEMEK